jgi:hypothetical protein
MILLVAPLNNLPLAGISKSHWRYSYIKHQLLLNHNTLYWNTNITLKRRLRRNVGVAQNREIIYYNAHQRPAYFQVGHLV